MLNDTVIDVRARLPSGGNVERERESERKDECGQCYLLQAQPTTCKWLLHIMSVVPLYGQQHDAMRPERLRQREGGRWSGDL